MVDIVIPIFNAYEYTVKCVQSVLLNTNNEDYNLILINDKSTDKKIEEYLNELEYKKLNNVYILHNENNLGFVQTVNKGMKFSENDVVLLNSDTEVTKNWLNKIKQAAYLNENTATVTPLTNNGTICSIPNYCEDNKLPENLSLDEYAEIIEKTSLKLYPDIPTAVGFCMYIKRNVINEIGLFDAKTFGKGYGEENDFCCRALEKGYTHILCDDTFIYHKGSTSFLGKKEEYIKKNLNLLNQKYSYYNQMIQKFIKNNTLKPIIDNIKFQLKIRNGKKNVLFLLHNDFRNGENHPIGGTEYHTKDIIDNLASVNAFVLYTTEKEIHLERFENGEVINLRFELKSLIQDLTLSSYDYKKNLEKIIDYFAIDIVHVQHFKTHTFDILDIAKERKIPIYLTLHDYYLICPKINLLDINNKYCKETRNKEMCKSCMRKLSGYDTEILSVWNKNIYKYLKNFDRIFAPSKSVEEIFSEYYKKLYNEFDIEIEVIEHGMQKKYIKENKSMNNDKFKVAFIGGIAPYKGSKIIHEIITKNKNSEIEWHIFGNIGDQRLNLLEDKSLVKHGRYERDKIQELLLKNNIDLICILSVWPETYSYTVSESIISNIPIVATDIGALGERINKYECGWSIPYDATSKDLLDLIYRIISNKKDYSEKLSNILELNLSSKEIVASKYEEAYISCKKRDLISNQINNKCMLNKYKIYNTLEIDGQFKESTDLIASIKEENLLLKEELINMKDTLGWKMINYIRSNHPAIKNIGKKIIHKVSIIKKI